MFHSFAYPDETDIEELGVRLWQAQMTDGEILFLTPEACDPAMYRTVRPMQAKQFGSKFQNFTPLKDGDEE